MANGKCSRESPLEPLLLTVARGHEKEGAHANKEPRHLARVNRHRLRITNPLKNSVAATLKAVIVMRAVPRGGGLFETPKKKTVPFVQEKHQK